MRRLLFLIGITTACVVGWSPQQALAHGGLWGCRTYSSNHTHYYHQNYYPNYTRCAQTYLNNCSYSSSGYAPYPNYASYLPYNSPGMISAGNTPLGFMGFNNLSSTNLNGVISQPSYFSMPLTVGSGPTSYLQIPLGGPAGRASYIQIPANAGNGQPSFLQFDLGGNAGGTVPSAPPPSPTSGIPSFGATHGDYKATANLFVINISKTSSDDFPTVVQVAEQRTNEELVAGHDISLSTSFSKSEKNSAASPTTKNSKFQFISVHNNETQTQIPVQVTDSRPSTSTSFSLHDPDSFGKTPFKIEELPPLEPAMDFLPIQEDTPWVVK